jgi:hypothetical protein
MAILNNSNAISPSGYDINNSLRFRSSASAYLNRTPASAGNRKTWTWSAWVKLGAISLSSQKFLFSGGPTGTNNRLAICLSTSNQLCLDLYGTATVATTNVYRDPSAWYHVVIVFDTTQSTAGDRYKFYVNGTQVTSFASTYTFTQNADYPINNTVLHRIADATSGESSAYFDGYLAEVNFIDGSAKTPSDFGETDTTTGVWKPKAYTGTFGTNGFYLKFSDIATTSGSNAGLGKDFSGNTNYWTTNNISVTAGTTYDAMIDSPTNTSATVANYAVLNPLDNPSTSNSLANANLTPSTAGASGWNGIRSTMAFPTTGKWYYEVTLTSGTTNLFLGIVSKDASGVYHDHADTFAVRMSDCALRPSGATATGTKAGYAVGDVFGVAIDCSTPTIQFYKNNSLNVTYTSPTFDPAKTYFPCFMGNDTGASATHNYNFGQRPFAYTPPTGYVALNTYNLPDSTIKKGNTVMDATLYTGNGSTQTITNASAFKPDFVWVKSRSDAFDNVLIDSVRGTFTSGGNPYYGRLFSNTTAAENVVSLDTVTALNSNGFSVNSAGAGSYVNNTSSTYVGWQWQAGQGTNTSNTSGSITSTVSVNATAGFSIVTWTANNSTATIGHGLGVKPSLIIVRDRAGSSWEVYSSALGATKYLQLNSTNAAVTSSTRWNNTEPTSTVFTVTANLNYLTDSILAYCWAEIAGFSKFGSYTGGNNTGASTPNANGPFIYLGFRPKFVLIKRTSSAADWVIYDSVRGPSNANYPWLYPNSSSAEVATETVDFLSNGFKIRSESGVTMFPDGATFIYAAFAENPFKNSLAR